jgi:type IV pilus assembly protein PilY1
MNSHQAFRFVAGLALVLGAAGAFAAAPFTPSAQPTGWISRPTLTDINVSSGNQVYYRGTYRMRSWNGDVRAHRIGSDGTVLDTSPWSPNTAASWIAQMNVDTDRKIVTLNGATKIPFRWANLSATQKTAIDSDATREVRPSSITCAGLSPTRRARKIYF